jgi:predicted DNA-binding transcriptional regulator AlpA
MEPEIIHIPELAKLLGRTESSIRSALQAGAAWLPPFFKQGSRICWRVTSVRKFLQECEEGRHTPVRPGRKRQPPPTLSRVG